MIEQIGFFILGAVALVSAILVITRRNAVHSAVWLMVTLFSVGGLYLMMHAEFLFAVQVILYVGGIMVLFLFVLMLVNLDVAVQQSRFERHWALAIAASVLVAAQLAFALYQGYHGHGLALAPPGSAPMTEGNTQAIGTALYQTYMLPVEIASILLLVAMVGAVIMAKKNIE
jgi:NADH-quinone oxidoreductase subunit J